jgi:hypothetical protein
MGVETEATEAAMKLTYDPQADAASVEVSGPILPGGGDYKEPLDQD